MLSTAPLRARAVEARNIRSRSAPIRQLRQRRLLGRVLQRDHPFAGQAAGLAAAAAAPICSGRQAVELRDAVDQHRGIVGCFQHVLPELRREAGHLHVDRLAAATCCAPEAARRRARTACGSAPAAAGTPGPGPAGCAVVQGTDARKQRRIEQDRVLVRRQQRGDLGLDCCISSLVLDGVEVEEHRHRPVEQLPGALQGDDGVLEIRVGGPAGDGRDLLQLRAHALGKGLTVVRILGLVEMRQLVRQRAGLQQGLACMDAIFTGRGTIA